MAIRRSKLLQALAGLGLALLLAGCQGSDGPKQWAPVPAELINRMKQLGMKETGQVLIRIYKESSELEVWKEQTDGKFALLKTYAICKWSGGLGPKVKEGDRQAPEGFYTVTPSQMNPKSSYYLSFNIGYPNAFDKAWGRTGSNLMVHGACSSAGCYSMTDETAGELFALARDSFRGGQRDFQIQAFPFRMTAENMARHAGDPNMPFWKTLKVGADHFEVTRKPPKVDVCNKGYVFDADAGEASFTPVAACPPYTVPEWITAAVDTKQQADEVRMAEAATALAAKQKQDAEALAVAAAKEEAKRQRAAERAAEPSLISKILGRDEKADAVPAHTPAYAETPKGAGNATPVPRKKPSASDDATASIAKDAPSAETPEAPPAHKPTVGQWIKRQFNWPDDPPAAENPG
jgi:murein L,D-transpeptidase YafK